MYIPGGARLAFAGIVMDRLFPDTVKDSTTCTQLQSVTENVDNAVELQFLMHISAGMSL